MTGGDYERGRDDDSRDEETGLADGLGDVVSLSEGESASDGSSGRGSDGRVERVDAGREVESRSALLLRHKLRQSPNRNGD